jgi:hypothetical protein
MEKEEGLLFPADTDEARQLRMTAFAMVRHDRLGDASIHFGELTRELIHLIMVVAERPTVVPFHLRYVTEVPVAEEHYVMLSTLGCETPYGVGFRIKRDEAVLFEGRMPRSILGEGNVRLLCNPITGWHDACTVALWIDVDTRLMVPTEVVRVHFAHGECLMDTKTTMETYNKAKHMTFEPQSLVMKRIFDPWAWTGLSVELWHIVVAPPPTTTTTTPTTTTTRVR